jgi:hypothetical protein
MPSKQHRFASFFSKNSEWNDIVLYKMRCFIKKKSIKKCQFPNQSSIEILILRINSIASLSNSNVSLKVGCLFYFDPWFWIYAFWPSIDQQTSSFFNLALDSINSSPYSNVPFPVWSLVLDFFHPVPNCPSNFNIYAIKPLIWLN